MKLKKLQRYTIYIILLHEITVDPDGLCLIWYRLFGEIVWYNDKKNLKYTLPELWDKRTSLVNYDAESWFADDNERIEALKECIKETHPKPF